MIIFKISAWIINKLFYSYYFYTIALTAILISKDTTTSNQYSMHAL